jgi:hypothetical protein
MAKLFLLALFLALILSLLWRFFRGALSHPPQLGGEERDRLMREAITARDRARGQLIASFFALPAAAWQRMRRRLFSEAESAKGTARCP